MSLPLSGPISLSDVNTTLSLSANTQITMDQTTVRSLTEYSTGEIKFSDFYGKFGGSLVPSGMPRSRNITIDDPSDPIVSTSAKFGGTIYYTPFIISKTNQLYGWGRKLGDFILGDNTVDGSITPKNLSTFGSLSGRTPIAISTGPLHSIALDTLNNVHTWGSNNSGQLGNNTIGTISYVPINISTYGSLSGNTIIAVAAGGNQGGTINFFLNRNAHNMALDSQGRVHTWGYNTNGQLGNDTTTDSAIPILISNYGSLVNKKIVSITAGSGNSFAIDSLGGLHGWGYNWGAIINVSGTSTRYYVPRQIVHGSLADVNVKIVAVSVGRYNMIALDSMGRVHSWGTRAWTGTGSTSTMTSISPTIINDYGSLPGKTIIAIAYSNDHAVVLDSNGEVHAWGPAAIMPSGSASYVPVNISSYGSLIGKTIVSIAAGSFHNIAIDSTNTIHTWGNNSYYQLGNGTTTNSTIPNSIGVLE